MYEQVYDPVSSSLGLTAIFAVLPLVTLFVLLGGLKWSAHWSALCALAVALVIAIVVYTMPIGQAVNSALLGAVFGLFPIMWIVWNALGPIKNFIESATREFSWPGLDVTDADGEPVSSVTFKFNWLSAAGTLLLVSGLITMLFLRMGPARALRVYGQTLDKLKWATLTVAAVLSLAYVMNLSGQTITLGLWIAGAGGILAFLSSIIGWLGVAVTGSDTSSNSLFGALQVSAAKEAGLNETLLAAANSSGGVLGKMISPQNLAIGAAAVGLGGREGELFRRVLGWSLILLLVMCVLVYLQSTPVLSWMVV